MAFTFGFYNSYDHDRVYDSLSISRIFDGLITDGVYGTVGDCFIITKTQNTNEISVGTGRAWFDHTWNLNDSPMLLVGEGAHGTLDRWDAIVIDVNTDREYRENKIIWVYGTAATNPVKPTLIHTLSHNQYPLAYIYRRAGSTITASDINITVGTDECPYCTGLLTDTKNIAQIELNDTATRDYSKGEYVLYHDELHVIMKNITQGTAFIEYPTSNYNIKKTTIAEEINRIIQLGGYIRYTVDGNDDLYIDLLTTDDLYNV
jgi:hypothetical protein